MNLYLHIPLNTLLCSSSNKIALINKILKKRTGLIRFTHCYSHLKENDVNDTIEEKRNKDKKLEKLINIYGEEKAIRYIEGNHQADLLANKSQNNKDIKTSLLTKYHNKYVIKSTRKRKAK